MRYAFTLLSADWITLNLRCAESGLTICQCLFVHIANITKRKSQLKTLFFNMMAFLTLIETKSTKAAQVGVNNTPRRRAREVIKNLYSVRKTNLPPKMAEICENK